MKNIKHSLIGYLGLESLTNAVWSKTRGNVLIFFWSEKVVLAQKLHFWFFVIWKFLMRFVWFLQGLNTNMKPLQLHSVVEITGIVVKSWPLWKNKVSTWWNKQHFMISRNKSLVHHCPSPSFLNAVQILVKNFSFVKKCYFRRLYKDTQNYSLMDISAILGRVTINHYCSSQCNMDGCATNGICIQKEKVKISGLFLEKQKTLTVPIGLFRKMVVFFLKKNY